MTLCVNQILPLNLIYKLFFVEFAMGTADQKISSTLLDLSLMPMNYYEAIRMMIILFMHENANSKYWYIFEQAYAYGIFSMLSEFYVP